MTPPSLPPEVTFQYRWDAAALAEAYRWHQRRTGRAGLTRSLILIVVLAVLGCLYYLNHSADENADFTWLWWAGSGAAYLALIIGLRRFYVPLVMRRNLAKSPVNDSVMTWRLRETGTSFEYAYGRSEMDWRAFMQAVQAPTGLLLYTQPLMFHWLPKASCASEADFEQAVKWVYAHVPNFRTL